MLRSAVEISLPMCSLATKREDAASRYGIIQFMLNLR